MTFDKSSKQHLKDARTQIERLLASKGIHSSEVDIASSSFIRLEKSKVMPHVTNNDNKSGTTSTQEIGSKSWQQVLDPTTGKFYYHNLQTGETQWDRPNEFEA